MKKLLCFLFFLLLLVTFTGCGTTAKQTTETEPAKTPEVIVFTDEVLEKMVRGQMNKPEGDITIAEAAAVTSLNLEMQGGNSEPRIKDVSALKYFSNLTYLNLNWALYNDGQDVDISSLANLTKLEGLYLAHCDISDINPLEGLVNLQELWIWGNRISDITPLTEMMRMESLWIKNNQISDINSLSKMTELKVLYMEENQITNLSPLASLNKLELLYLSGNPIEDYSPIKDVYQHFTEKDFEIQ